MLSDKKINQIKNYLKSVSPDSKVYIGCDSTRFKNKKTGIWYATYITAVVVHINNQNGCKVFSETQTLEDYDVKKDRPTLRMMNEAYKAVEAYQQLEEDLLDRDVEVHLDINHDPRHGSNSAMTQAVGYCVGVTGRPTKIKPEAFAASYAADRNLN